MTLQYEDIRMNGTERLPEEIEKAWFYFRSYMGWELDEILIDDQMEQLIYSFRREVHDDD